MKFVIDSNRVIAALVKESTTRKILMNNAFEFLAPEFIMTEIEKYKKMIIQKASISEDEFDILLSLVFERIKIISKEEYEGFAEKLKNEINDFKDIAYVAVCLAQKSDGIWTHDTDFLGQKKCKVYTNIDMLKFAELT